MTVNRPRLAELADQCVKCGLCVPLCPTYRVARTEAESPRGRIAFAAALAAGAEPSASMRDHLDRCLACMTCERVCPSHVKYGEIIVGAREMTKTRRNGDRWNALLRRPRILRWALRIANAVRGLLPVRAIREAPRIPPMPTFARVDAKPSTRGRIGLFIGCVACVADRDVHAAAKHLLNALGYDVVAPPSQGCCGALALHRGDVDEAERMSAPTRRVFLDADVETVLVSASGCFGTLRDHALGGTSIRVREIHEFIAADAEFANLTFSPLPKTAALHTPCTQANVAKADGAVAKLLARIPAMHVVALPTDPRCCGEAGDYFLRHTHTSDALRAEKLDQIGATRAALLVTSNVGCRVFLDNGLRKRAQPVPVTHPIVLLAAQLEN